MTTPSPEQEQEFSAEVSLMLRSSSDGEITLRQLALGAGPLLILVPDYDPEAGVYSYDIDATDLGGPEELADGLEQVVFLLRSLAEAHRNGDLEEESVSAPSDS